jgi:hypothetical protein
MEGKEIQISGLEDKVKEILQMSTTSSGMKRELTSIIRKAIMQARKNISQDAKDILTNDPRQAYKAVRSSVYKQIFGGQVNILPERTRHAATKYLRQRKLDNNPHQRGGNRRKRSERTMQMDSYEGKDRSFILRFINQGTTQRETRYGNRGQITARKWFNISSSMQMEAAANHIADEIELLLQSEFKLQ